MSGDGFALCVGRAKMLLSKGEQRDILAHKTGTKILTMSSTPTPTRMNGSSSDSAVNGTADEQARTE